MGRFEIHDPGFRHLVLPNATLVTRGLEHGGRNRARLFICGFHRLHAVHTNTRGADRLGPPVPGDHHV